MTSRIATAFVPVIRPGDDETQQAAEQGTVRRTTPDVEATPVPLERASRKRISLSGLRRTSAERRGRAPSNGFDATPDLFQQDATLPQLASVSVRRRARERVDAPKRRTKGRGPPQLTSIEQGFGASERFSHA